MRRYDSYKDSGVEWIKEIPSERMNIKLKLKLVGIVIGGTPDTSNAITLTKKLFYEN